MSDERELRIGIIGLGIGRFHASCFAALPGVRIVAVADRGGRRLPGPLGEFAAHYGAQPYELGEKMLAEESLDVVSICSPPASHRSLVELAAARGVHVLLEKPMAWSLGDCDAMIDACAKAGVGLQVNFPMRRLGAVQKLQQLLSAGDLGAPAMASADYVMGPRPAGHWVWADSGGPICENACHFIDLLRCLLGPVEEVSAATANALGIGAPIPDCAAILLRFRSGALASLVGGAVATPELGVRPRLSIYGSTGQAVADGLHHTLTQVQWAMRGGATQTFESGLVPAPPSALGPFDRYPLLEAGLVAFIASMREGGAPLASGEEGRATVEICEAALRSARAGRPQRLTPGAPTRLLDAAAL
jgi:predicted dehydrogenase